MLGHSCDTVNLAWAAPRNTGSWSPVTGYVVYYERADRVSPGTLPTSFQDVVSRDLPHRFVTGTQTDTAIDRLEAESDYVVLVLSRNKHGWGARWSSPVVVSTKRGTEAPRSVEAPAVHPHDEYCSAIDVRLPPFGQGCRKAAEFLVQVYVDASSGWTTVSHASASRASSSVRIEAINPEHTFLVRLVGRNSDGSSPPSTGTMVKPGPPGGCVSELDWEPDAPSKAAPSSPAATPVQLQTPTLPSTSSSEGVHFRHDATEGGHWWSTLLIVIVLALLLGGGYAFVLRRPSYLQVARKEPGLTNFSEEDGDEDAESSVSAQPMSDFGDRLKGIWDAALQSAEEVPSTAAKTFGLGWGSPPLGEAPSRTAPPPAEGATGQGSVGITATADVLQAGCRARVDGLLTDVARDVAPGELQIMGDEDEAALLARVAGLLDLGGASGGGAAPPSSACSPGVGAPPAYTL